MEEKRFKVLKKTKTDTGRTLMLLEEQSAKYLNRYATGIAPKDFNARVGGYISKTKDVNFVNTRPGILSREEAMYDKLVRESK